MTSKYKNSTDIDNLEEKKIIFGGTHYIYWTVDINDVSYTITSFSTTSIMFHIGDQPSTDAITMPKLTDVDPKTIKKLFKIVVDLIVHSAKTYQGDQHLFTAYFLLQPSVGDMDDTIKSFSKKGLTISAIGDTKTGGISFRKYSIDIDTKKL